MEVVAAGNRLALGSAQQRAVLALLVIHAGEPLSQDRLLDELWGERPPPTALHAVQVHISRLRKVLGAGGGDAAIRSSSSGYVLEPRSSQCRRRSLRAGHRGGAARARRRSGAGDGAVRVGVASVARAAAR